MVGSSPSTASRSGTSGAGNPGYGLALLTGVREAFEQAVLAASGSLVDSHYELAGRRLHIRMIGTDLADVMAPPFSHLRREPAAGHADLRIDLWDEAVTGPLGGAAIDGGASLGERWPVGDAVYEASPDGRLLRYGLRHWMALLDRHDHRLLGGTSDARRLSGGERFKPLSTLLSVWCRDRGVDVVHAGMVSRGSHGVLVTGPRRAGKSTTTLSCACHGFHYLGDDAIGVEPVGASFLGHSLYATGALEPRHLERFPLLAHAVDGDSVLPHAKRMIRMSEMVPGRLAQSARIAAIVLPRVVGAGSSRIREASRAEVLLALAPATLLKAFGPGPGGMTRLARLARGVPGYWLEIGGSLDDIPSCIDQILAEESRL